MIEKITEGNTIYAVVLRPSNHNHRGPRWITEEDDALQVSVSRYEAGEEVRKHTHHPRARTVRETQEVLTVMEGWAVVSVFNDSGALLQDVELIPGDSIVLLRGGHSLRYPRTTTFVEVKNGPWRGDDKEYL